LPATANFTYFVNWGLARLQEKQVENNYNIANKCLTNVNNTTSVAYLWHHVTKQCVNSNYFQHRHTHAYVAVVTLGRGPAYFGPIRRGLFMTGPLR